MFAYTLRRLALTVPVLLGVATLVFALIHLVPGDPAEAMLGESAPAADLAELRTKLGLDKPLLVQYQAYVLGLARGNLGTSFRYNTPVAREIGQRLGRTAQLALAAMAVSILMALPLGILGALFRGRCVDQVATTVSLRRSGHAELLARSAAGDCLRGVAWMAAGLRHGDPGSIWCCRPSRWAGPWPRCSRA